MRLKHKWFAILNILLVFIFVLGTSAQQSSNYLPINMENVERLEEIVTLDVDIDDTRRAIRQVTFHPSENILYSLEVSESIRIWEMDSFQLVEVLNLPTLYSTRFAIDPVNDSIVYGGWDLSDQPDFATLNHWQIHEEENTLIFRQGDENIEHIVISPDSSKFAVAGWDDYSIRIWDSNSLEPITELTGHAERVTKIAFLDDERLISSGEDSLVHIWNIDAGEILQSFTGYFFVLHPSNEFLLTSFRSGVERHHAIIDLEDSENSTPYEVTGSPFAFNREGDLIAVVDEAGIWLNNFESGEKLIKIGDYNGVFPPPIDFSLNGTYVATLRGLDKIVIWTVSSS